MKDPGPLFQDTIFRVLEAAPRGLTVERIRTQLAEAGATVRKDEIVRALAQMNERQLVQFGAARRWHVRQHSARTDKSSSTVSSRPDEYFVAIPCQAMAGEGAVVGPEMQSGRIDPSIGLLKQLLRTIKRHCGTATAVSLKLSRTNMERVSSCWNQTSPGGPMLNRVARWSFHSYDFRKRSDPAWRNNTAGTNRSILTSCRNSRSTRWWVKPRTSLTSSRAAHAAPAVSPSTPMRLVHTSWTKAQRCSPCGFSRRISSAAARLRSSLR